MTPAKLPLPRYAFCCEGAALSHDKRNGKPVDDYPDLAQQTYRLQALVAESRALREECRMLRAWAQRLRSQTQDERVRLAELQRELGEQWAMLARLPGRGP